MSPDPDPDPNPGPGPETSSSGKPENGDIVSTKTETPPPQVGDIVYVRALSTHRAAVAEVRYIADSSGSYVVRLATDWYDWDSQHDNVKRSRSPRAGEMLTVKQYLIESIRE